MQSASKQAGTAPSFDGFLEEIQSKGFADVLGYTVGRPLFDSVKDKMIEQDLVGDPLRLLILQMGSRQQLRSTYVGLADRLRADGHTVDVQLVSKGDPWWMSGDGWTPVESRPQARELIDGVTDWLAERASGVEAT
jgi:hypothetical protein